MANNKKPPEKKKEEKRKESDLFSIVEEKEEHTLKRILNRKIEAPIEVISDSEKEIKRKRDLVNSLRDKYHLSVRMYIERGYILEPLSCNKCCDDLRESDNLTHYDSSVIDIMKNLVREVVIDDISLIYIYFMSQSTFITFISEYYNYVEEFDTSKMIDKAYREIFIEIRDRRRKINDIREGRKSNGKDS